MCEPCVVCLVGRQSSMDLVRQMHVVCKSQYYVVLMVQYRFEIIVQ